MESMVLPTAELEVVRNYFALVREFREQQLYHKAEETLLVALTKLPNHPFLLIRLANLYSRLDMPEKALKTLNRLVHHHPKLASAFYLRARVHQRLQDNGRAINDYMKALGFSLSRDQRILRHLLPLLLQQQRYDDALSLIYDFQVAAKNPVAFAEIQAECFLHFSKNAAAFNKLREALLCNPRDPRLLKGYLKLSIQSGKKSPKEVYQILKLSLPEVAELEPGELELLELDHLMYHGQTEEALRQVEALKESQPDNWVWRKKCALMKLETGESDTSVPELQELFREHFEDDEIRIVLENYFLVNGKLTHWKRLVQQVLIEHSQHPDLYAYLCGIGNHQDWLAICKLDADNFIKQVQYLPLPSGQLGTDQTFRKLPFYALNLLVSRIAIQNTVPSPEELWEEIERERERKKQSPPFQLEDLQAAYPTWLFALHLYFYFQSCSDHPASFQPALLQNEYTALSLFIDQEVVDVDISQMLTPENPRLKNMVKSEAGYRWRIRPSFAAPELKAGEMTFYTEAQFREIADAIQKSVKEQKLRKKGRNGHLKSPKKSSGRQ